MRNLDFTIEGARDNTIRIPIDNPGGVTGGRLLVDTGSGWAQRTDVVITFEGDYAVVVIPAASTQSYVKASYLLQIDSASGTVSAASGEIRLSGTGFQERVEINNEDGTPISVVVDRSTAQPISGTVDLGASSLAALETVSLSPESLASLETVSLGPSSQIIGHVSTSLTRKVAEGKAFITGAAITLGGLASTERACIQLVNPAGNTKAFYIFALTVYSSITQQVVYMEDATMTTPTALVPFNINRASAVASTATASSSTAAPTGGAGWPNQSRVQSDAPLNLTFPPIILPPGKSLLIRGTIGDAQVFTANAYWFEE